MSCNQGSTGRGTKFPTSHHTKSLIAPHEKKNLRKAGICGRWDRYKVQTRSLQIQKTRDPGEIFERCVPGGMIIVMNLSFLSSFLTQIHQKKKVNNLNKQACLPALASCRRRVRKASSKPACASPFFERRHKVALGFGPEPPKSIQRLFFVFFFAV